MSTSELTPRLEKLQSYAVIIGAVGFFLCLVGAMRRPAEFWQSYLFAWLFWAGVTIGPMALLLLHHVVGGGWGFIIRRLLEAAIRLLPWMLLLFVPIIINLFMPTLFNRPDLSLYEWADPRHYEHDEILQAKRPFLNVPFFILRTIIYFAIWMTFAHILNKWSEEQDRTGDPEITHRFNMLGAGGIVVYVLTLTFAAVDWVLSLSPHWFSSIIGLLFVVGQGLSTLCLMHILVTFLGSETPILKQVPQRYFRDLGNLTLAFTLLWAYMSFSQFLITYNGNTAEEAPFYMRRTTMGWGIISLSLVIAHFFLPFLTLLSSSVKVRIENLAQLAAFIIFMRFVDLYWWVAPTFREAFQLSPSDLGAPLMLGGVWLWLWSQSMKRDRPLLPLHDPRFAEHWPPDEHHEHDHDAAHAPTAHGEVVEHV